MHVYRKCGELVPEDSMGVKIRMGDAFRLPSSASFAIVKAAAAAREREWDLVPAKRGECSPLLAQECNIPGCHLPTMRTKTSKTPSSSSPRPTVAPPAPSHLGLGLSHSVTQAPKPWNHAPDVERSVGSPGETAWWGLVRFGCPGRCFIAAAPLLSRAYTKELYLIRSLWRESSLLHASPRSRSTGAGNHCKGSRTGRGRPRVDDN